MKWIAVILCFCVLAAGLTTAFGNAGSTEVVAVSAVEGEQIRGGQTGCGEGDDNYITRECGTEEDCPGQGTQACPSYPHAVLDSNGTGFTTGPLTQPCYICGAQLVECSSISLDVYQAICDEGIARALP